LFNFQFGTATKKVIGKHTYGKKNFFKVLWKWCLFEKKFLFFNEKLFRRSFV